MEVIFMKTGIRSKIDQRLRELSWLEIPGHPGGSRISRQRAARHAPTWLGAGLLYDPRTGLIGAF